MMTEAEMLADALGALRQDIRALQAREKNVRDRLVALATRDIQGTRFKVLVESKRHSRFDKSLLPKSISEDRSFWKNEARTIVRVFPLDDNSCSPKRAEGAPAQPTRRVAPQPYIPDDYEVIDEEDTRLMRLQERL